MSCWSRKSRSTACAASTDPGPVPVSPVQAFDLDRPWRLDDRAAVRPEPFGAMLYHFGTRNLSFLKSTTLLTVLRNLAEHPTARAACAAAGVGEPELPAYGRALATLAGSGMIVPGDPAAARRAGCTAADAGPAGAGNGADAGLPRPGNGADAGP